MAAERKGERWQARQRVPNLSKASWASHSRHQFVRQLVIVRKSVWLETVKCDVPKADVIAGVMEIDHSRVRLVAPEDVHRLDLKFSRLRQVRFAGPTLKLAADVLNYFREL